MITWRTRLGRRTAAACASSPPRLCPTSVTGRPVRRTTSVSRRSSRRTAASEQSTFQAIPER
ncbi:MAG TPA: hypothetical protein VGH76_16455 [Actinomycetospora sp.]